jgi:3'-5' exoribonuclease
MCKYWGSSNEEKVKKVFDSIQQNDVIKVSGLVKEYNGKVELSINEGAIKVLQEGEFNEADFIKTSQRNKEEMEKELAHLLGQIKDADIKLALNSLFSEKKFYDDFVRCPAAMYRHHGWVFGLLEHTLSVAHICLDLAKYHKLDTDWLIAGALIHDIGKVEEFEALRTIKVTDKGILLGHIAIGIQLLTRKLDSLSIPQEKKDKLMHFVLSHHGSVEFGSPKVPMFPEAYVVAKADEIDAYTQQIIDVKENAKTEDSFFYHKEFGNVYLK